MSRACDDFVRRVTAAAGAWRGESIQSLWSGYGEIVRYQLDGALTDSVIVKHVRFPSEFRHPQGWHNDISHRRKVRSYQVEMTWYGQWAGRCDDACRVARCHAAVTLGEEHIIVLEDLDAGGFPRRLQAADERAMRACLDWLAHFHARFLGCSPDGLWPTGTYWHLATRLDELAAMRDDVLREAAPKLDALLAGCRHQTLVHGDAKLANFCFSSDAGRVAAVDFQYVGGGCGIRDVAYFLGSCLDGEGLEHGAPALLDSYFATLRSALQDADIDADALEREWRGLYPVAQTDFYRFLAGWMPDHRKINGYIRRMADEVLKQL